MAEELLVVLNRRDPDGFGFSLLGKPGFPPVIYDIEENSPAAESGKVEAGDMILQVNETDVIRCNAKEVLKCLRLSKDPVSLRLKRDPAMKEKIRDYLLLSNDPENQCAEDAVALNGSVGVMKSKSAQDIPRYRDFNSSPPRPSPLQDVTSSRACENESAAPHPKFEAYMMTGDRVLKLTRNQQISVLPKHQKKIDSLTQRYQLQNSNTQATKSVPSSPVESPKDEIKSSSTGTSPVPVLAPLDINGSSSGAPDSPYVVQISRSDDHIQRKDASVNTSQIDDDVTSSLNTLLDTREERKSVDQRVLWTYNAPRAAVDSVSEDNTSRHSPTSVSSSVMSSISSSTDRKRPQAHHTASSATNSFDLSPDYNDECDILNSQAISMEMPDASDSDSTLMVSEPKIRKINKSVGGDNEQNHRLVIQVKGLNDGDHSNRGYYNGEETECDDELIALTEGAVNLAKAVSPPHSASSEDECSDVESLHSFHYSPKGVDYPSAVRLAKRLYALDGFKKSDVSRHLCKNNDFSRAVAEEYLKHFEFTDNTLDVALRKFLKQFCLTGETQERERVLVHFSKRYLDCNPGVFSSQDAVHTLTCAIMLLNTDLHGPITGRKMSCNAFVENLAGLNDGGNFPKDILKRIYQSIKSTPIEWATDEDAGDVQTNGTEAGTLHSYDERSCTSHSDGAVTKERMLHAEEMQHGSSVDYKKGYVMRKCCVEPNGKRTPLGKRGWKMYYCTLRDLVLYLHKDENGFKKSQIGDGAHNAIRLHHALATKAADYTKKQYVFRLETADRAEYLFQTSDSKELQSWVDTINLVCASFSAPALAEPVSSQKKFQRPLLPSAPTRLDLRDQLKEHQKAAERLEIELEQHRKSAPERGAKSLVVHNYKEKDTYLCYELKRYKTYIYLLESKLPQMQDAKPISATPLADIDSEEETCGGEEEPEGTSPVSPAPVVVNNRKMKFKKK